MASEINSTSFTVERLDVNGDGHIAYGESADLAHLLNRAVQVLRSLLEPFAHQFKPPFVKQRRGAGVKSQEELDTAESAITSLTAPSATRTPGPLSLVLQLEGLGDALDASVFRPLLASILPLSNRTTAHLYISARDGSALENSTRTSPRSSSGSYSGGRSGSTVATQRRRSKACPSSTRRIQRLLPPSSRNAPRTAPPRWPSSSASERRLEPVTCSTCRVKQGTARALSTSCLCI